jgi:bifunctional non-homologous end joining protein LigD
MTTGSKGAHIIVVLNRKTDFDSVRDFATDTAQLLVKRYPEILTVAQRKEKREDRLYIDVSRNAYGQSGVAPYSLRALPGAPVATPLDWNEFFEFKAKSSKYTIATIMHRLGQKNDPWHGIKRYGRSLVNPRQRLNRLLNEYGVQ